MGGIVHADVPLLLEALVFHVRYAQYRLVDVFVILTEPDRASAHTQRRGHRALLGTVARAAPVSRLDTAQAAGSGRHHRPSCTGRHQHHRLDCAAAVQQLSRPVPRDKTQHISALRAGRRPEGDGRVSRFAQPTGGPSCATTHSASSISRRRDVSSVPVT